VTGPAGRDPFALRSQGRSQGRSLGSRMPQRAPDRPDRPDRSGRPDLTGAPAGDDRRPPPDRDVRQRVADTGRRLDRWGTALLATGVGAKAGVTLKVGGRGLAVAAGVPLALFAVLAVLVTGVVPSTGIVGADNPPADPAPAAVEEIPGSYLEVYQSADDEHRVPWPVLAAMGYVLTEHGARSPYDTLRRSDEQRFPRVDPAIAPGTAVGAGPSATCRLRLIGDSLLVGMGAGLPARLPACTLTAVDGQDGRTIEGGTAALAASPLTDETALVVVLGTNDLAGAVTAADLSPRIEALLAAAGGLPVVWTTTAATGLATGPEVLTEALAAAARRHPGLIVADWAAYLADRPDAAGLVAGDGVHYTPAGYDLMADWLARQVGAPGTRTVDAPAGDGGLGPLLLNPTLFPGLGADEAQGVARSIDLLAEQMADAAEDVRTEGAEDARAARFGAEFLPESEALWRAVVEQAPVVAGDSACLQPDPTMPVPRVIEVVWRCEMLRTPPTVWSPGGMLTGPDAQNQLLDEAHVVAATWSAYGTAPCDPTAPFAGVFPLPATAVADRCDPVGNVRAAARLVLDQESLPLDRRPGTTEWERAAAGWATMPPALGDGTGNRFATEGPPAAGFTPSDTCTAALGTVLDAEAAASPAYRGLAAMAPFAPDAVDFDPAAWDANFATTPLEPLVRAGGPCDPGTDRAAGFSWLAGELAARGAGTTDSGGAPRSSLPGSPPEPASPDAGLAGAAAYAAWVSTRGEVPVAGRTGLVPRLHNPRLAAPDITRPAITGGATPINPADFADRVIARAKVYAGHAVAAAVETVGWEPLAALGIPEHAARAYAKAAELIGGIEPGCAADVAYLAGFGAMESGHGTVAVSRATGESDGPSPRGPVTWDPLTGESQPRILGPLLDGSGVGGNVTPRANTLSAADRRFYAQDEPHLRAVGPTQFMPGTWESVRAVADGNGDGVADPFNYYDGALATAVKACRDGDGLATEADQRRAALVYNSSRAYADGVLAKAAEYRAGLAAMGYAGAAGAGRPVVLPDGPVAIVDVYGIEVNAAIAGQVQALVDAARADGLELAEGSGGWRSSSRQIALRREHCGTSDYAVYEMPASQCSPPTAIPGTSEHERGLAIDFRCNGQAIGQRARSNPCVVWLSRHAAEFGFYNLPSEAWHWSTTGR
jgi:lysophospholipase L1-like esterase